jgi:hypothetical protein
MSDTLEQEVQRLRKLLVGYVRHVGEVEGSFFLSGASSAMSDADLASVAEIAGINPNHAAHLELARLSREEATA